MFPVLRIACVVLLLSPATAIAGTREEQDTSSPARRVEHTEASRTPRQVPEDLDTSRLKASKRRAFRVSLRCSDRTPRIGRMHNWTVRVADMAARPLDGATIDVSGGMPAHDHGFPTEPRVTRYIGNGTYLVEGVKFNMSGWWQFVFRLRVGEVEDEVRFNVIVRD